ncbi:MAG: hypothetical protein AB1400_05770 [Pseudomonadota bacterium]
MKTLQLFIMILVPICLFGMAAWLIERKAVGWGWFLFGVVAVCGSMRIKVE